jgi:hypothetical protein
MGQVVHSGASKAQNIKVLFFMLEWDRFGFHKKHTVTRYAELVFLHPVGSVSHVVHSSAFGHKTSTYYFLCSGGPGAVSIKNVMGHITLNLCFCIRWDLRVT